jgi:hypothetical protein
MSDIDSQTHSGKVEPIREPNQGERKDMMGDQLVEVLARLFQHQEHHDHLLSPIRRL